MESSFSDQDDSDIQIPSLNPLIKLFKSTPDLDGQPRWSLYQPVANQYYHIKWSEFECLARFHKHKTASTLIKEINRDTTLDIDEEDIKTLIIFLQQNGLLILEHQNPEMSASMPAWKKLIHNYLFFTLPLFKPAGFLEKTLPAVRPLLSKTFMSAMLMLLMVGVYLTAQRFDEFTHTFLDMLSVRGAILTFFVFTAIKIVHEFAHAYVATKHGVKVPHMGVALILMYPVLYTETTDSWRLDSKKKRIEIGLAGVMAELALAAIFLMVWNISPPGLGQSIAFGVVAISLIGSLFVNLNPMMRFDGYFVLSDALNIENLHARAIALARWQIRKTLFGLQDTPPDAFTPALHFTIKVFGFTVIIYRLFLFLGIAFLVYTVFFKPLGFFMMLLELLWFIGIPIWKELQIWWQRRGDIFSSKRSFITIGLSLSFLIFLFMPVHTQITTYGVLQADQHKDFYAPTPSLIQDINVTEGQHVKNGDVLAILESDDLEKELEIAKIHLTNLEFQKRRGITDIALYRQNGAALENQIEEASQKLKTLQIQKDRLIITASFDGIVRDLPTDIHKKRYVSSQNLLFRVIKKDQNSVITYVGEHELPRIKTGNIATFHPNFSLFSQEKFIVTSIDPVNVKTISKPELTSLHGGNVPAILEQNAITPLETTYAARLKPLNNNKNTLISHKGQIRIKAERESAVFTTFKRAIALFIRESGLN